MVLQFVSMLLLQILHSPLRIELNVIMYIFFNGRIYARILGLSNLMLTLSGPVTDEEKKLT